MKKMGFVVITLGFLTACTSSTETKIKVDSLGKKFDSAAQKTWDSTKEKGKELKEKIEEKLNNKDSLHK